MKKRATEISIQFKQPPLLIFNRMQIEWRLPGDSAQPADHSHSAGRRNCAAVWGEGPDSPDMSVCPVNMDFDYAAAFGKSSANGYERLLLDAMLGDQTLFAHRDGVETTWALYTPILEAWAARSRRFSQLLCGYVGTGVLGPAAGARRARVAEQLGCEELSWESAIDKKGRSFI